MAAWRASGLTAEAFSSRRGYSRESLYRWSATPDASEAPTFVRLEVAPAAGNGEVAVEVGVARVHVSRGFDAELIRAVVAALTPVAP